MADVRPLKVHRSLARRIAFWLVAVVIFAAAILVAARLYLRHTMTAALPQLDGTLHLAGLSAQVRVDRDSNGVPSIIASSMDDLILAQGYITAQDRLWQMDMMRRHTSGRLAEVLGSSQLQHDITQRTLQLREAAERNLPQMPAEDRHYLERYAAGVNAEIAAAHDHLPPEFALLGYKPDPWTALDSLLVAYAMVQDLSTSYPTKLNREAVEARLPYDLVGDLYPVGSSHDHPPYEGAPARIEPFPPHGDDDDDDDTEIASLQHLHDLLQQNAVLATSIGRLQCDACGAGSNNWVISGAHTSSGKPILSNDPHLSVTVPGIWYTSDLRAGSFHAAGAAIPGVPFIVIGHNDHVAWGFTNSYADVQDLYIEQINNHRFRDEGGNEQPLQHQHESIRVKHGRTVQLDIPLTSHGGIPTPVISALYPSEKRAIALRWSVYDPAISGIPLYGLNRAASGAQLVQALSTWGSPSQNLVWADDGGHIGYHLVGAVPLRGPRGESGLAPLPVATGTYAWTGYIPYDELPSVTDPADGVLATANARITPANYPYAIALDWAAPNRIERIWNLLQNRRNFTPQDSLAIQDDVYSALDQFYAQHIVFAVDHAKSPSRRARQAANLLRNWNGQITTDSPAANITEATRLALQTMLLEPRLHEATKLYTWGESSYAFELLVQHQPQRWLPPDYPDWNELITAALEAGLHKAGAPADLTTWTYGSTHTLTLQHPVFGSSALLRLLSGSLSTGAQPMPGNAFTVRAMWGVHSASMRFTTDLANPNNSTLSLPMGQSGNPASPWFMDGWDTWHRGTTRPLETHPTGHTLTLAP